MSINEVEYQRGRVDAILSNHDKHLDKINGSVEALAVNMEKMASNTQALTMTVQRLADAADADRKTVKVTAEALKQAEEARRDKSEKHWTPFQRIIFVIGGLAGIEGIIYQLMHLHH